MRKVVTVLLFSICLLGIYSTEIKAKEKTVGGFCYEYESIDKNTCYISKIYIMDADKAKIMKIPSELGGKKVVRIGMKKSPKEDYDWNILGVYGDEEDGSPYPKDIYKESKCLEEVIIPSTIKAITKPSFTLLPNLKKIIIKSKTLKNLENFCGLECSSFHLTKKNKYYQVKNGLLLTKNGKQVYGPVTNKKDIKIPNGVKKIKKYAFAWCDADSIFISKTVNSIGDFAFRTGKIVELKVSKKNKRYAMSGDCLYSKKSGRLVAAINRNGKLVIPSVVTKLKGGASSIGGDFKKIVIPKSVKLLGGGWDTDLLEYEGALYFKSAKIPKVEEGGMSEYTVLYVPKKATTKYYYEFAELNVDVRAWD